MKNSKIIALALAGVLTTGAFIVKEVSAQTYEIQPGDTLYTISQQFDTTVESLKEVNQVTSDLIFADEALEINSNGNLYKIEPGDTLFRIAMENDVSVEQLQAWNGLHSDLIYAGETLSISGPSKEVTSSKVKKARVATANKTRVASSEAPAAASTPDATQATSAPTSNVARTMTVEATAYTAYCTGCSGTTANGTDLRANPNLKVIAVDPRVIPLGTKVWVEGYGEAVAADTGGAIKGNKIDVFIPNKAGAYDWGRKSVTIKILD